MSRRRPLFKSNQIVELTDITTDLGSCRDLPKVRCSKPQRPCRNPQCIPTTCSIKSRTYMANNSQSLPPIRISSHIQATRPTLLPDISTHKRPGTLPPISVGTLSKPVRKFPRTFGQCAMNKINHNEIPMPKLEVSAANSDSANPTSLDTLASSSITTNNVAGKAEVDASDRLEKVLRKIGNLKERCNKDDKLACAEFIHELDPISKEIGFERIFQRAIEANNYSREFHTGTTLSPITPTDVTVVPLPGNKISSSTERKSSSKNKNSPCACVPSDAKTFGTINKDLSAFGKYLMAQHATKRTLKPQKSSKLGASSPSEFTLNVTSKASFLSSDNYFKAFTENGGHRRNALTEDSLPFRQLRQFISIWGVSWL